MSTYPLHEQRSTVADANGVATVKLGPTRTSERWLVESVAVESTSSKLVPELREYLGNPDLSHLTGTSRTGNLDSGINEPPLVVESGENIVYLWTGCDVGAECQVTISGRQELP